MVRHGIEASRDEQGGSPAETKRAMRSHKQAEGRADPG
jgi:hypothetical protein